MERSRQSQLREVTRILKDWHGSDAADTATPDAVAEEIDRAYMDYLAALRQQTVTIRQGQEEWERRVG